MPTNEVGVRSAYRRCALLHSDAELEDIGGELLSWQKLLKRGDRYSVNWVKEQMAWMFNQQEVSNVG
jgi:hypothetical protein